MSSFSQKSYPAQLNYPMMDKKLLAEILVLAEHKNICHEVAKHPTANESFVNNFSFLKNMGLKWNIMKARKIPGLMAFPGSQDPIKLSKLHKLKFMPSNLLQIEKRHTFHWTYESSHKLNAQMMNFRQSVPILNSKTR